VRRAVEKPVYEKKRTVNQAVKRGARIIEQKYLKLKEE
jgi:hypothetical protein